MKDELKEAAIRLRRQGKTYREILSEVLVAKSTLSLWLRSVGLAKRQRQRLTEKRRLAALRGSRARVEIRREEVRLSVEAGSRDILKLSTRDLFLIGVALYWAEGSKQYEHAPSTGVVFSNSDARMHVLFLRWLEMLGVDESNVAFELYVYTDRRADTPQFKNWWARQICIPVSKIKRVYLKKGNRSTNRKNTSNLYHGLLRIKVKSSTSLNRRISGWVEGIHAALGSGVTGNTPAFGAGDSRFET